MPPRTSAEDQILSVLARADVPVGFSALHGQCRIRTETFCKLLVQMQAQGKVLKTPHGYTLAKTTASASRSL